MAVRQPGHRGDRVLGFQWPKLLLTPLLHLGLHSLVSILDPARHLIGWQMSDKYVRSTFLSLQGVLRVCALL